MAINSCYEIVPHEKYINLDKKEPFMISIISFPGNIKIPLQSSPWVECALGQMRSGSNALGVKGARGQMRALAGLGSNM